MQNLYSLGNIRRIHIEITANCNSACPQCERFIKHDFSEDIYQPGHKDLKQGDLSPVIRDIQGSKGHMSFETFKNCINDITVQNLRCIEFNGTWGDAIMHPQLNKFIDHVIECKENVIAINPDNRLGVKLCSNSAIRPTSWWTNLAHQLNRLEEISQQSCGRECYDNRVVFAIDGLDNVTHQMYRRGCEYDRVIENAQAFIDAGGVAEWQWIEFEHNKHQLDDAVELARKMGFKDFMTRGNRAIKEHFIRPEVHNPNKVVAVDKSFKSTVNKESKSQQALDKKLKKVEEIKNKALTYSTKAKEEGQRIRQKSLEKLETKYQGDIQKFLNKEPIKCEWGNKGMINVEFNGMVHPCCHMNVYMNRLWRNKGISNDYEEMQKAYEDNWNNINQHTLQDILLHKYYLNDLEESWDSDRLPRLQLCKDNCTQQMDESSFPIANYMMHKK
mgnify:CR=1 FL=1